MVETDNIKLQVPHSLTLNNAELLEIEHTSARECAAACETQQSVYDKWKSTDEREWFADMK